MPESLPAASLDGRGRIRDIAVGYKVTKETEVIFERLEDRPGMLGKVTLHSAEAGINLTTVHLATDARRVFACENISALETAWKELAAVASG